MKKYVLIALMAFLFAISLYRLVGHKNPSSLAQKISTSIESTINTPTPLPFEELTIPYLRNRTYTSSLGELIQFTDSSTHTSYLTSYTSDGLKINGLLTQPKGEMPAGGWPAVVFLHGYIPPTLYRTENNYVAFVNAIARQGFVVFKIDLRGHDESEGEPGGAYYSSDYIIDTLNARAALQNSNFVNPDKIGLWGHSMAGNVVMRSLAVKTDIPAAVIWAGAVYTYADMVKYGLNDNSYRPPALTTARQQKRQQIREKYGNFDDSMPFWQQVAVTNYIPDMKTAIQFHHAVDDTVVNIGYSRDIMKLLDEQNIDADLFEYSSGGHNISGANFNTAMQRTVDFYKKEFK